MLHTVRARRTIASRRGHPKLPPPFDPAAIRNFLAEVWTCASSCPGVVGELTGNIRRCGVFFTPDLMYFFFWQQVSYTFNLKYVQRYYIIRHIFAVIESRGLQLAPE